MVEEVAVAAAAGLSLHTYLVYITNSLSFSSFFFSSLGESKWGLVMHKIVPTFDCLEKNV